MEGDTSFSGYGHHCIANVLGALLNPGGHVSHSYTAWNIYLGECAISETPAQLLLQRDTALFPATATHDVAGCNTCRLSRSRQLDSRPCLAHCAAGEGWSLPNSQPCLGELRCLSVHYADW